MWILNLILLCSLTLGIRGDYGELECGACQQINCQPLPSNCKYGVKLDSCHCCRICAKGKAERCHIIPDPNSNGVVCEWVPSVRPFDINQIPPQLQNLLEFNAFFRSIFNRLDTSDSETETSIFTAQLWSRYQIPEADFKSQQLDAIRNHFEVEQDETIRNLFNNLFGIKEKRIHNSESTTGYPTCGLTDYVTLDVTKADQSSTERSSTDGKEHKDNILNGIQKMLKINTKGQINDKKGKRSSAETEDIKINKTQNTKRHKLTKKKRLRNVHNNCSNHSVNSIRPRTKHHIVKRMKRVSTPNSDSNKNKNNAKHESKDDGHAGNSNNVKTVKEVKRKRNKFENIMMNRTDVQLVPQNIQNGKENNGEGKDRDPKPDDESQISLEKSSTATKTNDNSAQVAKILGVVLSDFIRTVLNRTQLSQATKEIVQTEKNSTQNISDLASLLNKRHNSENFENIMMNSSGAQLVSQNTQNGKENNGEGKNSDPKPDDEGLISLEKSSTGTKTNNNSAQVAKTVGEAISDIIRTVLNRTQLLQATKKIIRTEKNSTENMTDLASLFRHRLKAERLARKQSHHGLKQNGTENNPMQKQPTSPHKTEENVLADHSQDRLKRLEEYGRNSQERSLQSVVDTARDEGEGQHNHPYEHPVPNNNKDAGHKVKHRVGNSEVVFDEKKSIEFNNRKMVDERPVPDNTGNKDAGHKVDLRLGNSEVVFDQKKGIEFNNRKMVDALRNEGEGQHYHPHERPVPNNTGNKEAGHKVDPRVGNSEVVFDEKNGIEFKNRKTVDALRNEDEGQHIHPHESPVPNNNKEVGHKVDPRIGNSEVVFDEKKGIEFNNRTNHKDYDDSYNEV